LKAKGFLKTLHNLYLEDWMKKLFRIGLLTSVRLSSPISPSHPDGQWIKRNGFTVTVARTVPDFHRIPFINILKI